MYTFDSSQPPAKKPRKISYAPVAPLQPLPNGHKQFRSQIFEDESEISRRFDFQADPIGEGTYGKVYMATCRTDNVTKYALKRIELNKDDGVPSTCLREICLLKELYHPNIVRLQDVILHKRSAIFMVFEYIEQDLKMLLDKLKPNPLPFGYTKHFIHQLLRALSFCHIHRVIHRDLKPQNILISNAGIVKLADFGLARAFSLPSRCYTHEVVTLWYRSPEILLGTSFYTSSVDIWSLACIFAECVRGEALFNGDSEIDQLFHIFQTLGSPSPRNWPGIEKLPEYKHQFPHWPRLGIAQKLPGLEEDGVDLLEQMLIYKPFDRITAKMALAHRYMCTLDSSLPPISKLLSQPKSTGKATSKKNLL